VDELILTAIQLQ